MPIILKMRKPKCFTFSTEPLGMHRNTSNPDMMTIPKHALFQPQKWCKTWPPSMSTQIKYAMPNMITTIHLAGEAQIPMESLHLDLYDKLTTPLQEKLAVNLRTLDTFAELSASCLSLDTELRRIAVRVDRQKRNRDSRTSAPTVPIIPAALERAKPVAPTTPRPSLPIYTRAPSQTPQNSNLRQSTPVDPTVTCFNCHRTRHYASSCPEPKRPDLKEIEEDLSEESGKEESSKEDH